MITATLWIENSSLNSTEIRAAVQPAETAISEAGFTVRQAYEASLAECDGREYDKEALKAWATAEAIAMADVSDESSILAIA